MGNHSTGSTGGIRQGSDPVVHTLRVRFNSTANRKFVRITASVTNPVFIKLRELGVVAFNAGTLNQYRIGTSSAGAQVLTLRNTPAAAANAEVAPLVSVLTADTDIWVGTNLTGTTPTTGEMWFVLEITDLNVNDVNPNAIP